ncbi:MAG: DUF1801 domain-containing protein [Gemmatimonadota bacterium]|nr:DUF1801 domain-containing protein [Gemmatimonadota bacterium]MDH4347873.1 DUF1801 domain-containing protein [Gemmatimonadota bacterium]MDH5283493.1 DUF1801 domain-containing protein [Gemmatimonadota bacterium]
MVSSKAKTVADYLKELSPERRKVVAAVRSVVRKNLPKGYREVMGWGMISYGIPLSRYPDTYNGQPLCYAAIAAQKNHYAVYLMNVYADSGEEAALRRDFEKAGKKLDMGKCCVRFRKLEDISLPAIGRVVRSTSVEAYITRYEESRAKTKRRK